MNSCSYYDVSNKAYARLNAMIKIMNERHKHFVSEVREFGLLHETDLSLPIPRLESSLYDDCESSLPLESNAIDDAPLTNLEEAFDPPLTSLPFVTPSFSSIPTDTGVSDLTLLASPLSLAQCTGLEMGKTSTVTLVPWRMIYLVGWKSLHQLSHVVRRLLLGSYVVMGSTAP